VFLTADDDLPATTCSVSYTVVPTGGRSFQARLTVKNTGNRPVDGWTLRFELANGQVIRGDFGATAHQSRAANGRDVTITSGRSNGRITPGATVSGIGFFASFDGTANAEPPNFSLNGHRCGVR
jgi:hypothetical protein